MGSRFKVEGFDEADHAIESLGGMTNPDDLRALGMDALEPVADTARGLVRSRSGRLRRSIGVGDHLSPAQAAASSPEAGTVETYVGPGALTEAITEEFGTVFEPGSPYMRPSWDSNLGTVQSRLVEGARRNLRRITGG